jgi:hypothetical protein
MTLEHGPQSGDLTRPRRRHVTPAVGTRGEAGGWRRAINGARVRGFKPRFEDGRWSFLYRRDTRYAADAPEVKWQRPPGACAAAKTSQPRSAGR